ncbi:MAG: PDZ domain-containing protein [Kordiimonadaceae bacterium]|nr:PDZ domain-containing protein [Kordiimonadaceae bacterium]
MNKENEAEPYLGPVNFNFKERDAIVSNPVQVGSPLYTAGVERGDQIVKLGGRSIRSSRSWDRALSRHDVGETVTIEYISKGENILAEITFIEDPEMIVEKMDSSEDQEAFLLSWIGED